ncbi:uncharacterized protein LOC121075012 isoform X3 [Cygnus olor]|uniref:uncharacterized protein LOC121075012 isoform X3 n=1 Tax=Cygnus olor TaxID=8869 RepID=UPI001ADE580D|nr:uncharacterized protein LOC121075012 isoform X3 [Cygnus olor]
MTPPARPLGHPTDGFGWGVPMVPGSPCALLSPLRQWLDGTWCHHACHLPSVLPGSGTCPARMAAGGWALLGAAPVTLEGRASPAQHHGSAPSVSAGTRGEVPVPSQHPKADGLWFALGPQTSSSPSPSAPRQGAPAGARVAPAPQKGPQHPAAGAGCCGCRGTGVPGGCRGCRGSGMGLLGCGQEKGMQSTQRGRGQGLAAAQPTMELFMPLHFTILLCLCLLLLGPCSWLALHVLLLVPISSTIFVILILAVTSLVLLSVAYLELPQPAPRGVADGRDAKE